MQDDMERMEENQEKMMGNINNLRYRMKELEQQNQKLQGMMLALLKAQGVAYDEEDAQENEFIS